jgi:hypothetical protein
MAVERLAAPPSVGWREVWRQTPQALAPIAARPGAPMHEGHEREQYFFDAATLRQLADFVSTSRTPCCLCAPLLGKALVDRGHAVRILDVDVRFASLPGFLLYDLQRPGWLGEKYDLVVCDPPFYRVSLSRLFGAVRTLARNDFAQPLLLSYLRRRAKNVVGTFAPFALRPTGYCPGYQTAKACERNDIELFGNLSEAQLAKLVATQQNEPQPG